MAQLDKDYRDLISDIRLNGTEKHTRAGDTLSVFGRTIRHKLSDGFPLLTLRKLYYRGIFYELLWFLKGDTNIKYLVDNNVHIWDADAYRFYKERFGEHKSMDEFLLAVCRGEKEGDYTYGDLGPVYGKQWRDWNGIDQIRQIIKTLKTDPDNRRLLCVAYNPSQIADMALPPCHVMFQFYTRELNNLDRNMWMVLNKPELNFKPSLYSQEELDEKGIPRRALSIMWTQRSVDIMLGLPFNIASYALLCCMVARCCNMLSDEVIGSLGDTHIYKNQFGAVDKLLERDYTKFKLPKLVIKSDVKDIDDFKFEDFELKGYESYPKLNIPLSVG